MRWAAAVAVGAVLIALLPVQATVIEEEVVQTVILQLKPIAAKLDLGPCVAARDGDIALMSFGPVRPGEPAGFFCVCLARRWHQIMLPHNGPDRPVMTCHDPGSIPLEAG